MGLVCIIEGVETQDQLATLSALGCQVVQGYYFSKPMSEDRVLGYLAAEAAAGAEGGPLMVADAQVNH
jgi:EAL domain-containing protein (putative c-di-GMP-specific phosphodiesterase class I)